MGISVGPRNANVSIQAEEFQLNRGDVHNNKLQLGSLVHRRSVRVFKGCYDFSVQGGAISTISLYDPVLSNQQALVLPASFIISKVLIDVLTAPVGASATIALTSGQNAADLLAATAIASFTGLIDGIPTSAATTNIKIPAAQASPGSTVSMVIATTALTAGKFNVFITGFMSDAQ